MATGQFAQAAAVKNPTPLIDSIKEQFVEKSPVPPLKIGSYVRSSGIAALCPREEVLCAKYNVIREKKFEASTNLIFAHGTGLHYALQNIVLPALKNVMLGHWRCEKCTHIHKKEGEKITDTIVERPVVCGVNGCDGNEFTYREIPLLSMEYMLTGHPDGFLRLPQYEGIGLLEAKSTSSKGAWEIKFAPYFDHLVQVQLYMWFTDTQWAQVLYWEKSVNGTSALTEHHVERDEETIQGALDAIKSIWTGIRSVEEKKDVILPERICANRLCPKAETCSVSAQCFEEPNETAQD